MKKSFTQIESRGLPGGPNEQFTYITGVFSTEGYKSNSPDVDNLYNIIDSGDITMEGVDFPVMGTDNLGNSQMMTPGNNYQFPGDQVFEVPMAQEGFELNQTSDNPFIYGDWAEVSRNVNPATGAITIFDERTGNREVKYSKRGVNWDVGYKNWLAAGNKGTLADFKIEAERWKKSKTENESDTQNRERTLPGDEVSITGDFYGSGIGDTIVPTGPGRPTRPSGSNGPGGLGGPSEGFYGDVGVQDNTGITSAGNSTIQPLTPRPITLIDQPEIPFSQQYPGGSMSPEGEVLRDFYVDSESTYEVNSRKNNNSKEKVGSTFLEDTTVTDGDGYTNVNVKSVGNGNREKFKQVFNIYDTEDNLLATQVDKTGLFGKPVTKFRATSEGEKAGYGLKRMGGSSLKAQDGKEQGAISAYEEPAWYEKAFDRLASPMTTFGYSARNQDIPDNLPINMEDRNLYDSMIDVVNPFAWIKYGAQAKRDYDKDEYLNAGFNALGAIPIVPAWLAKGRNLKNAYKYNPFAYNNIDSKLPEIIQFNRENNNWIRQVGRSGIDDVQQTGVVREMDEVISPSKFNEKLEALRNQQTGITFSLDKRYNGPFFKKGETFFDYNKQSRKGYDGKRNTRGRSGSADYIIETKPLVSDDLFQPAYMDAMHLDAGGIKDIGDIGIMKPWGREADNFNYYKKDWWEGYKRTPLEKLQQGGSLPQAQDGKEMGITNELLAKQAYVESNWDPKVKNSLGYMGLGQIGDGLIADYKQKNNIEGELDPYDPVQNAAVQRWSMNELYNTPWINKEGSSPENRLAKTLAAYNWGRGRVFDMLTEQKEKGIDIYKGSEWLNDLPQETQDYIKMTTTDNYNTEKRPFIQKNYLKALEDASYSSIKSIYFKQRGGETYTIQSGDNLGKIAAQYNMDYKDLASFNNIADPNLIMPNQVLNIPDRETSTTSNTNQDISYRVKPGDSLSKIAKNYRTSVGELQRINNIENPNLIQVDQEILFPETVVRTPVEPTEPSWISTDDIKQRNDSINQLSDIDVVMKGQILNDPNERYIVIDKPNNRLKVYQGDTEVQDIEVILGKNKGDAQTVTKSSLANADQLMRIQEQLGIEVDGLLGPETKKALANSDLSFTPRWTTDYSKGNLSTGAGVYQISNTSPTSGDNYQNAPSFNMTNEAGIEVGTSIHGTPSYRLPSFGNDNLIPGEDENNRMSSGCINGKCTDLQALYDLGLPTGTSIYILPEDEGNKFELVDGKPVLRMSQENREAYKGDYTDEKGREQTGQGGNYTTETLTYKPIRAKFDKEKFVDERFTLLDFNDDEEFDNTTQPFISALEENKKEIMLAAKIPGDVYNQIAKMAFGIYGTESEFGDTHSWVGNAARGANKKFGSDGSSPDVIKKYEGFDIPFTDIGKGAQDKDQSVGYTQMRWTQLNDKEKTALESFGITSNEDFLDPTKSAIATATVLGIRYNEQLTADQKKDVWKHLPSKWNKRANYTDRVKNNSVYLNFEQLDVLKAGGEIDDSTLYRNYINGIYNGGKQEKQAEKVYDKLNRRHYWKAKAMDMSPSNYVLTYVVGQR